MYLPLRGLRYPKIDHDLRDREFARAYEKRSEGVEIGANNQGIGLSQHKVDGESLVIGP